MNLGDIRNIFSSETRLILSIDVWAADEMSIIGTDSIDITEDNYLWGTTGFAEIPVQFIRAIGTDEVEIKTDIPIGIFRAWKDYTKKRLVTGIPKLQEIKKTKRNILKYAVMYVLGNDEKVLAKYERKEKAMEEARRIKKIPEYLRGTVFVEKTNDDGTTEMCI